MPENTFDEALHPRDPRNSQFVDRTYTLPEDNLPASVEDDDDLTAEQLEEASTKLVAFIGEDTDKWRYDELAYVEYDDQLAEEQVEKFLAGDYDTIADELEEVFADGRYDRTVEVAKAVCEEKNLDWDAFDWEQQQEIRQAISDRDQSDGPMKKLVSQTRNQLMRTRLATSLSSVCADSGSDVQLVYGDATDVDDKQFNGRVEILNGILAEHGLDVQSGETQASIRSLVNEGPWDWHDGVELSVIWYGGIEDATAVPFDEDPTGYAGRKLAFTGPTVVLLDTVNGSGFEADFPGQKVTATVTAAEPTVLDSPKRRQHGYGWDDTAGVVHSAFEPEGVETEWVKAEEPALV